LSQCWRCRAVAVRLVTVSPADVCRLRCQTRKSCLLTYLLIVSSWCVRLNQFISKMPCCRCKIGDCTSCRCAFSSKPCTCCASSHCRNGADTSNEMNVAQQCHSVRGLHVTSDRMTSAPQAGTMLRSTYDFIQIDYCYNVCKKHALTRLVILNTCKNTTVVLSATPIFNSR